MKRIILAGLMILMAGMPGLLAQPKGNGKQGAANGPAPKSKGEADALNALITAQQQNNPDGIITAAEALLTKYADTQFKDTALFMEAAAYQAKGDKDKMQVYLERTLATNPKHFQASLMLAEMTLQGTREHDLDHDQKLARADQLANDAIASIAAAAKPNPALSDQQWDEAKKDLTAQAHDVLGMSALQKKNYELAITELKSAVEGAAHPEPAFEVRLASAYQQAGKNDEAIAEAQKVMDEAQTPQQIKSVAQSIRAAATVAKNGKAPAANSAPPQVDIKKQ